MIDAERMLGSLVRNALSGGNRRGRGRKWRGRAGLGRSLLGAGGKGALAMGALGVAIAAFEHLTKEGKTESAFDKAVPPPRNPPNPPRGSVVPPPLPRAASVTPTDAPPPPPPPSIPTSPPATGRQTGAANAEALLLVRAMIAAANADHRVDDEERERVLEALEAAGLGVEERRFLLAELKSPLDPASLAAETNSPELARQVYLASLMAIEVDTQAEQDYLAHLADRLGLSEADVNAIEDMLTD